MILFKDLYYYTSLFIYIQWAVHEIHVVLVKCLEKYIKESVFPFVRKSLIGEGLHETFVDIIC